MGLSERLKYLRYKHKISQSELGKVVEISKSAVSSYETSGSTQKLPSLQTLTNLAYYFNVSTDYLLGITDNDFPINNGLIQLPLKTTQKQYEIIKQIADVITSTDMLRSSPVGNCAASKLRTLRLKAGLLQEQVAVALSCHTSAISSYESGTHYPRIDTLLLFTEFFDVSMDFLVDLSDNPNLLHDKNDVPYVLQLESDASREQIKLIQRFALDIIESS